VIARGKDEVINFNIINEEMQAKDVKLDARVASQRMKTYCKLKAELNCEIYKSYRKC